MFWRSPIAAFFTLAFPMMFFLVFTAVFGNDVIAALGVTRAQFYAPALAVYGAVAAAYSNLAISMVARREEGILKRVRGTPLPPWIHIAGRLASTTWIAVLALVLMLGVGVAFFGVRLYPETLAAATVVFIVGVASFAGLGMMVASLVSDSNTAPVVTNFTLLPLAFISNIFIPPSVEPPGWVGVVGDFFPLKHFASAFADAFNPTLSGSGFQWSGGPGEYAIVLHLAVMGAWGLAGVALALRYFRWEPVSTGGAP